MGLRFPSQQFCQCFFVTTTFSNHTEYGNHPGMYRALADSLNFYGHKYGAKLAGYVLMPTHLHLLVFIDGKKLGSYMRDFKKFVSQKAARELGIRTDKLWMSRYDRVAVESEAVFRTKLMYILNNPVKAGLCGVPESWHWSSARDYSNDLPGPVEIWKGWG